jgi:hypothetical protein
MISPQEFISTLFADAETVCISEGVPLREDPSAMWFNNMSAESRLFRRWNPERSPRAMYYSVCTVDGSVNDKGRLLRGRANLVRPHVLVLDDIGDKTGAPDIEPTYILESSSGSFQWGYALTGTTHADLGRFEALVKAIHGLGYGDAGAGGSYRVVRVVGSANLKPGRGGFRARLTHWSPDNWYHMDRLAFEFGLDLDDLPVVNTSAPRLRAGGAAVEGADALLRWLVDHGMVVSDAGGEFIDIICPWADQHTGGANTAGYSPRGRGAGGWSEVSGFRCLHEHCAERGVRDLLKFAISDGAVVDANLVIEAVEDDRAVVAHRAWRSDRIDETDEIFGENR